MHLETFFLDLFLVAPRDVQRTVRGQPNVGRRAMLDRAVDCLAATDRRA